MSKTAAPSAEATKDFILIKIPRNLLGGRNFSKKISDLERGLQKSIKEAASGRLAGPFNNGGAFLYALKNPAR